MELRLARPEDAPALAQIYRPYVTETTVSYETLPPDAGEMARRIEETTLRFPWLCAQAEGRVLGYAYAHAMGQRQGYDWSAAASVYLAADCRGRGLGRRLYTALEALLTEQGYCNLYALVSWPGPESAAFHEAMGYTREGLLKDVGRKFGRALGVAYYAKALPPRRENPPPTRPFPTLPAETVARILAGS